MPDEPAGTSPSIELRGVDFGYGRLQVLFGVDISVQAGEVLALLGTNGAGKSTILRIASGLARPWRGTVHDRDTDVTRSPAERRAADGVVLVPGGKAIFPRLTVADNLRAGAFVLARDRALIEDRVDDVLRTFPKLRERLSQPAGTLSGGEQQMLAIAKGLLLRPRIVLIDELSLGLAPAVVHELLEVVAQLNETGTTVVLVEQSLNVALAVSDRAVFLEKGAVRFSGPAAELAERDDLARAIFLAGAPS